MANVCDGTQPKPLLDEIREMFRDGGREDALELIDLSVSDYANDFDAELLKLEMCLEMEYGEAFIGQTLAKWERSHATSERFRSLRDRVEQWVSDKLAQGRRKLERGYVGDAGGQFKAASDLLPNDPAVSLSAALALVDSDNRELSEPPSIRTILSGLSARKGKSSSSDRRSDMAEHYFQLTLERGAADSATYKKAADLLVQLWLSLGEVGKALTWLDEAPSDVKGSELITDVNRYAFAVALHTSIALLRNDQIDSAKTLLAACDHVASNTPILHLLWSEVWIASGYPKRALRALRKVLRLAGDVPITVDKSAMRSIWGVVERARLVCSECGKQSHRLTSQCEFCAAELRHQELLIDRYDLYNTSETIVAHAGMAELLLAQDQRDKANEHLEITGQLLAEGPHASQSMARLLQKQQLLTNDEQAVVHAATALAEAIKRDGLTTITANQTHRITVKEPDTWLAVPFWNRLSLGRNLLRQGYVDIARGFIDVAFVDNPKRKTVKRLAGDLATAIDARRNELLLSAQQALDAGDFDAADLQAEQVLTLCPTDYEAMLVRGQARLQAGRDLVALADFQAVMGQCPEPMVVQSARFAAVSILEKRSDLSHALALVNGEHGDRAEALRQRLERRQRGIPVIHVMKTHSEVMYDTLKRTATNPYFHGYFAVAARSVGRPGNVVYADWTERALRSMYEFVQVLGGLRNVVGNPIFALRLISSPDTRIPGRGKLAMALVVRISAEDTRICETRALDLWQTLKGFLPAQQGYVYGFEPVVDEAELDEMLTPFEVASVATVARRESVPDAHGDRYTVSPFTLGSLDLHNLCHALLNQSGPALLSVHLLPTELMAWEMTALDQMMLEVPAHESNGLQMATASHGEDPIFQWWQNAPRWMQAQGNRRLIDSMQSQAYLVTVNIAGSSNASSLLPESIASSLFGPANSPGGSRYGGYEIARASNTEEFEIAKRNLAHVDMENWLYTAAPDRMFRLRHLMSESEAVLAFRFPVPTRDGVPGVPQLDVKPVTPTSPLPVRGVVLGESVVLVAGKPLQIRQSIDDRRRHTYVVGKTGVGKTTLLQGMALHDIENGHGVCIVDPHGDLIESILGRVAHRADDVVLFDPSDDERPIGLNLLEAKNETEKYQIVNEFIGLLVKMYDPHQQGIVGPRFQHAVRNSMLTVMSVEGSTLVEVVRALTDISYVKNILPKVDDPLVRNYWEKQIANTSDFHKSEILDYIVSKFSKFVGDRRIRNIVGQPHTTLDFRHIMDNRGILLVNLSKGKVGPQNAQFLGLLLVQRLLLSALSRAEIRADERPDFFLYVDEFQNFATDMFGTILSEGRKYGVASVVANQYLTQLSHEMREAIFGNVGSVVSFRVGTQDASELVREMYPVFGHDDLINLPRYTACVKLMVDGIAGQPFTMRTVPDFRPADMKQAEAIRQSSRQTYGRDVANVSDNIMTRFSG